MKRKVLSAAEKKALALDIKAGTLKDKDIAKRHGITTRTVERYREKLKPKKPVSALSLKRVLELTQMQSMIIYYLEELEKQTQLIVETTDIKLPGKRCEMVRENLVVTLNIHNSLASFVEQDTSPDDYEDSDVQWIERILEAIPEEHRDAVYDKIFKSTKEEEDGSEDPVQQEGRHEAGDVPPESG